MTDVENAIWVQVYSWHMASYQKRHDCDGMGASNLEKCSVDAMEQATDAVAAFRSTSGHWISTETHQMLKRLDKSNLPAVVLD